MSIQINTSHKTQTKLIQIPGLQTMNFTEDALDKTHILIKIQGW